MKFNFSYTNKENISYATKNHTYLGAQTTSMQNVINVLVILQYLYIQKQMNTGKIWDLMKKISAIRYKISSIQR